MGNDTNQVFPRLLMEVSRGGHLGDSILLGMIGSGGGDDDIGALMVV